MMAYYISNQVSKLEQVKKYEVEYKWIKDNMQRTVSKDNMTRISYFGVKISKVENDELLKQYVSRRNEMFKDLGGEVVEEKKLFHCTNNADFIVKHGFDFDLRRADPNGMFGRGIYFAELSSSTEQFKFEGPLCDKHDEVLCRKCTHKLLVCRVALGKQFEAKEPMIGCIRPPETYHSVVARPEEDSFNHPEHIIYNSHQAIPSYLVEYKIKK